MNVAVLKVSCSLFVKLMKLSLCSHPYSKISAKSFVREGEIVFSLFLGGKSHKHPALLPLLESMRARSSLHQKSRRKYSSLFLILGVRRLVRCRHRSLPNHLTHDVSNLFIKVSVVPRCVFRGTRCVVANEMPLKTSSMTSSLFPTGISFAHTVTGKALSSPPTQNTIKCSCWWSPSGSKFKNSISWSYVVAGQGGRQDFIVAVVTWSVTRTAPGRVTARAPGRSNR